MRDRRRRRRRHARVHRDAGVGAFGLRHLAHDERLLRRLARRSARCSTRRRSAASTSPPRRSSAWPGSCSLRGVDMLWYPIGWTAGYLAAAGLRRRAAAPFGRLHAAGLRASSGSSRCGAEGRRGLVVPIGAALPDAAVPGRRADPARPHRGSHVGRRLVVAFVVLRQRRCRRDAQHHARAGLPVLAQAAAPCSSRRCSARGWSGTTTATPSRHLARRATGWSRSGGHTRIYLTYSLILATFLGTMGLPHVVVRFYTNHDGRAARRTTVVVLVLLGSSICCRRRTAHSDGSTPRTW